MNEPSRLDNTVFLKHLTALLVIHRVRMDPEEERLYAALYYRAVAHLPENYVLAAMEEACSAEYMPKPFDLIQVVRIMQRNDLKPLARPVFNPTPEEAAEIVSGIQEHLRSLDERSRQHPGPTSPPTH